MNLKVLFLLISLSSQFAFSASWKDNKDLTPKHPCYSDAQKYCQTSSPDDSNRWRCLGQNYSDLSPKCSVFMKDIYRKTNDCAEDIFKNCSGASANYGKWTKCLDGKKNLAPKCQAILKKWDSKESSYHFFKESCKADFDKHCPNLKEQALTACSKKLFNVPGKLSKTCLEAKNKFFGNKK